MFTRNRLIVAAVVVAVLAFGIGKYPGLPIEWVDYIYGLANVINLGLIRIASAYNEDGTPSSVAYVRRKKGKLL